MTRRPAVCHITVPVTLLKSSGQADDAARDVMKGKLRASGHGVVSREVRWPTCHSSRIIYII